MLLDFKEKDTQRDTHETFPVSIYRRALLIQKKVALKHSYLPVSHDLNLYEKMRINRLLQGQLQPL